jgi:glycine dehydrogenase subunit 2
MGAEGLREVAEVSMINFNYLHRKLSGIRGVSRPYNVRRRLDQARYSLQRMKEDTGIGIKEVNRRVIDYGVGTYFTSHHPWIVPEPFTPEPCEKADIDYWAAVLSQVSNEAYSDPEMVKTAPHNSTIGRLDESSLDDPEKWAMTWRAYLRKRKRSM